MRRLEVSHANESIFQGDNKAQQSSTNPARAGPQVAGMVSGTDTGIANDKDKYRSYCVEELLPFGHPVTAVY